MATIDKSIRINAEPGRIWEILTMRAPEFYTNVSHYQPGPDFPAVGSSAESTFTAGGGFEFESVFTVVEMIPARRLVYHATNNLTADAATWIYTFEEEDTGQTRLDVHVDYKLVGNLLGKVIDKVMVERQNRKLLDDGLANLKALAEREAMGVDRPTESM